MKIVELKLLTLSQTHAMDHNETVCILCNYLSINENYFLIYCTFCLRS